MHPTVGRIVHYQTYGTPGGEHPPETLAAIVTKAKGCDATLGRDGCPHVSLHVLYGNGTSDKADVPYAEEPTPGHWSWPPRA
ncbi:MULTISPECIES: hypothetical protein [unclassified Nocardia]|uniref:hypothetical protein n=1 Tax=unclassified Nocardia TaxID=2637762 RepID=UPI00278BBE4C|nr:MULTISPECIES: hypothetical protein [unclassified Nocardia]